MRLQSLLLVSGCFLLVPSASGVTVFSTGGTPVTCSSLGGDNGVAADGVAEKRQWTQTSGYTNVSISAALETFDANYKQITAYLTNQTGPGTTVANQIAVATVTAPVVSSFTANLTSLFTGLTLGPGTYHLTLVGDPNSPPGHPECVSRNPASPTTSDTGVSGISDTFVYGAVPIGGKIAPFPPASNFVGGGAFLFIQATGDPIAPQIVTKSFTPNAIAVGGTSQLSFSVSNPAANTVALSGIGFTDALPSGVVVASPNGLSGSCGVGVIAAVAGSSSVSLSGATLAPGSTCTFSVNVVGTAAGVKNNVIPGQASSTTGAAADASAMLTVVVPPVIGKTFQSHRILPGGTTALTLTVTNPNTFALEAGFTDTFPAGLVIATPSGLTVSCGGAAAATAGSNRVTLATNTLLNAGASCTVTVNVTAPEGTYLNSVQVVTINAIFGNTASDTLVAIAPPGITKAFGAATIPLGGSTSLSFTITNPNTASALNGIGFTDTLPAGLVVAIPAVLMGGCGGGSITATPGSNSVSLSGAVLGPGSSCLFSVNVTGTAPGIQNNSVAVSSTNGGVGNTSNASVTVIAAPGISKSFGAASIALGGSTSLSFTLTNPNAASAVSGLTFTDTLPGGLAVSTPNGLTGICGGGVITAVAGSSSVSLSGATLAASGSCTFSVNVTATAAGIQNNSVTVNSANGGAGNTSNASVTVIAPPVISKAFLAHKILPGGNTSLTFTITNPNSSALAGVAFNDTFPAGLVVNTPNGLTGSCGGTVTAVAGSNSVSLAGAPLAGGASCTVTVTVTAPEGVYLNSVQVTSANGGTGNTASDSLTAATPPNLSKSFGAVSTGVNNTISLTFRLVNPNQTLPLTGLQFSDTLPTGLVVATPNGLNGTCPGGTITAIAGGNLITLGSATLASQASCTFSVNVTANGAALGSLNNSTSTVTSNEALPGAAATASVFIGDPFQISYAANLSVGDSFVDITNAGTLGAALQSGTTASVTGAICANVYAFTPDEQLVSCCSCPVTPNGLVSLSAKNDLASNTLTPAVPTALVVKVVATVPVGSSCANSAAAVTPAALANGLKTFGTTLHATPVAGAYGVTERPFSAGTLSAGELSRIATLCNFILANGSGFGICRACTLGGQGATRQ